MKIILATKAHRNTCNGRSANSIGHGITRKYTERKCRHMLAKAGLTGMEEEELTFKIRAMSFRSQCV